MASQAMTPDEPTETSKAPSGENRKFLSAPGIAFLIIVTQVPFAFAIWFSFTNWNLLRPTSTGFIGWDRLWRNYSRILTNPDFLTVIINTVILTLSVVVITFLCGLGLALLLNRPFPGRAVAPDAPYLTFFGDAGRRRCALEKHFVRPLVRLLLLLSALFRGSRLLFASGVSDADGDRYYLLALDSFCDAHFARRTSVPPRLDHRGRPDRRCQRFCDVSPHHHPAPQTVY